MVAVKEKTKVKTGTVVKIGVDDTGAIRVTTGSTPWVDLDEEEEEDEGYETLPTMGTSAGSVTQVTQVTQDGATYKPTEINYNGKRYIFREPLDCKVTLGSGDTTYHIEYPPFDIWGAGYTMEEAVDFFNYQFADTYDSFNEDGEDKLAPHYINVLRLMNEHVTNVITHGNC